MVSAVPYPACVHCITIIRRAKYDDKNDAKSTDQPWLSVSSPFRATFSFAKVDMLQMS